MTDLFGYWQNHPPTHILVGAYLAGGKKTPTGVKLNKTSAKNNFHELAQAVAAAGGMVNNVLPKLYKV